MVFSGLVIACRFATWPTRRSPLLVNATTDGVIRPPSAFGMMVGSPPSMYAAAEFVVPRSMPMTFATSVLLLAFAPTRHRHQRGTDNPVVESICLLVFLDDGPLRLFRRNVRDRFVLVRIERLPDGVDALETLGFEDPAELPLDEPHAFDPRRPLELVRDRCQGAVVRVEHVEQPRDEIGLREFREFRALGFVALAVVREIRGHALQVVRELFRSLLARGRGGLPFGRRRLGVDTAVSIRAPLARALLEQLFRAANLVIHQRPSKT